MVGKILMAALVCFGIFGYIHDGYHRKNRPIDSVALLGLLLGFAALPFFELTTRIVGYIVWVVAVYFVQRSIIMFNALRGHFLDTIKEELVRRVGKTPDHRFVGIMKNLFNSDPYSMKFQLKEKWNLAKVVSFQCIAFGRIDDEYFVGVASLNKGDDEIKYQVKSGVSAPELEKEIRQISPWEIKKEFLRKIEKESQNEATRRKAEVK